MAEERDLNLDPITDEPGAHPLGTGVGATAGGMAGAAAGALGGPVGAAVGLVAGAVVGGLGGKAAAEGINPTDEAAYWRSNYNREPYYQSGRTYDDYAPAYEYGWTSRAAFADTWDTAEPSLANDWSVRRGNSSLSWDEARPATRAAWERIDRARTIDSRNLEPVSNDDVIDTLNDLIETSRDGELGFREVAEHSKTAGLRTLFSQRATECATAVSELRAQVVRMGGKPAEGGTTAGAVHRGWTHLKGIVGGASDEGMLNTAESAEDQALGQYRKALKQNLPSDIRSLVERQLQGVQRNHDQIKRLRDIERNKS